MAKFLSDVLTPEDIMQHQRTLLIAGVGAGKNTFFENLGDNKVLIVTSRKAKVAETLGSRGTADYMTMARFALEWREHCETVMFGDFWIHHSYDVIVFDEIHAAITDATFAESMCDVFDYMRYGDNKPHIVFTTATPQPVRKYCDAHEFHTIDVRTTCRNITPNKIVLCNASTFLETEDRAFCYYANRIENLVDLAGYLYSERKETHLPIYIGDKKICYKELTKNPDNILTTSVLREGVNIFNNDPTVAVCESHDPLEAYQFAGRFRNGVDTLYILLSASQNNVRVKHNEVALAHTLIDNCCDVSLLEEEEWKAMTGNFVYTSPSTGELEFNYVLEEAIRREKEVKRQFAKSAKSAEALLREYFGEEVEIERLDSRKKLEPRPFEGFKQNEEDMKLYIQNSLSRNNRHKTKDKTNDWPWVVSAKVVENMATKAKELCVYDSKGLSFNKGYKVLNKFGYECKRLSKDPRNKNYSYYKVRKKQ